MFPDIARDDVFRLETRRLWLRWPRVADAKAIERYSSRWEVARMTARIPHPYPPGEAERFIFTARESNALGRDLILVITPIRGKREPIGMISLESRLQGRLTLGYALAPEVWGKGFATEAAQAAIETGFTLTGAIELLATAHIENPASRRVLEKCGFVHSGTGLEGAPARGGMVPCDRFRLERAAWSSRRAPGFGETAPVQELRAAP
jgi:RimJ/RimL family protein N-acetyltransferase